jgi:hypothetical protein
MFDHSREIPAGTPTVQKIGLGLRGTVGRQEPCLVEASWVTTSGDAPAIEPLRGLRSSCMAVPDLRRPEVSHSLAISTPPALPPMKTGARATRRGSPGQAGKSKAGATAQLSSERCCGGCAHVSSRNGRMGTPDRSRVLNDKHERQQCPPFSCRIQ